MATDSHYIPAFSIEDVLLDKDDGAPLSGGKVYFEQDNQRGVLKNVYQITGTSPNYTFVPLPNPVILISIGTFEDALGNPVIPYFYPYDGALNPEYYYIRVLSSGDVPQFTRERQPFLADQANTTVLSAITNEISNPQFAVVNFDTTTASSFTYTLTAGADQVLDVAPDWSLVASVGSSGTVTVSQTAPAGSLNVPNNPATLLKISSTGVSSLRLRTRLTGSPNLWGSGFLSAFFIAKTFSGTPVVLNMYYSQSNGTVVDQQFLPAATLPSSGSYTSYNSTVSIPVSNSSDTFPNAYVDIYFDIPLGVEVEISSIMLAYNEENEIPELQYDQESVARQIDHLYHYAYPIVPVGTIIDFAGFSAPTHYVTCDGAPYSRVGLYRLFSTITTTETVTLANGVNTFTVADSTLYYIGMKLEGIGITAGTNIANIVVNTITMSNVATFTGSSIVRFFIGDVGDGSTTFNVPDLRGYVVAGSGLPTGFSLLSTYGAGNTGGSSLHTLTAAQLPPHSHTYTNAATAGASYIFAGGATLTTNAAAATGNGPGTSSPFNIVQPTILMRKCIRYQ